MALTTTCSVLSCTNSIFPDEIKSSGQRYKTCKHCRAGWKEQYQAKRAEEMDVRAGMKGGELENWESWARRLDEWEGEVEDTNGLNRGASGDRNATNRTVAENIDMIVKGHIDEVLRRGVDKHKYEYDDGRSGEPRRDDEVIGSEGEPELDLLGPGAGLSSSGERGLESSTRTTTLNEELAVDGSRDSTSTVVGGSRRGALVFDRPRASISAVRYSYTDASTLDHTPTNASASGHKRTNMSPDPSTSSRHPRTSTGAHKPDTGTSRDGGVTRTKISASSSTRIGFRTRERDLTSNRTRTGNASGARSSIVPRKGESVSEDTDDEDASEGNDDEDDHDEEIANLQERYRFLQRMVETVMEMNTIDARLNNLESSHGMGKSKGKDKSQRHVLDWNGRPGNKRRRL